MVKVVLDASAVLAVLLSERGGEVVAPRLHQACVSSVNYSEILARAVRLSGSLEDSRRHVDRHQLLVVPFDTDQAVMAASLIPATKSLGLSFADRACLGLGLSRGLPVLTADKSWGGLSLGVAIEVIR
ncbi:type II toxin-antitoxin system VapC family toxin [Zavarzinella formosa]|uniref:type II toxin-antitoxin system VapC family toxin n=1 Tax=Zavarzinella formosa TaxID=360055 RepID=UPI0002DCACC7|nr:type II toxin-antitoxin system VapC family toxin [Zavarzinella formosa]